MMPRRYRFEFGHQTCRICNSIRAPKKRSTRGQKHDETQNPKAQKKKYGETVT